MKAEPRLMEERVGVLTDGMVREVPLMKPASLVELLDNPHSSATTLVIDCRPFTAYNTLHVATARNAYCPPILLRRKPRPSAAISLDFIVRDSGVSKKLLSGNYTNVVVYDEEGISRTVSKYSDHLKLSSNSLCINTNNNSNNNKNSTCSASEIFNKDSSYLNLVLDCLHNQLPEDQQDRVHFLEGGFREFLSTCPSRLLASQNLPSVMVPPQINTTLSITADSNSRDQLSENTSVGMGRDTKTVLQNLAVVSSYRGSNICRVRSASDICHMAVDMTPSVGEGSGDRDTVISTDTVRYHSSKDRGDPAEVLPWLYIGNAFHASQDQRLIDIGITALLNVAEVDEISSTFSSSCRSGAGTSSDVSSQQQRLQTIKRRNSSVPFCHMSIPIVDSATADISGKFPDAINFIENVRQSGGRCLVHCRAGISRSATICMAYLMKHLKLNLDEAHDFLKQRRRLISPNLNFLRQLSEFEATLKAATDKELLQRDQLSDSIPTCLQQLQQLAREQLLVMQRLQKDSKISVQQIASETELLHGCQAECELSAELQQKSSNQSSTTSFSDFNIKQSTSVPLNNRPFLTDSLSSDVDVLLYSCTKPSSKDIIEISTNSRDNKYEHISHSTKADSTTVGSSQTGTYASNSSRFNSVFSSIPIIHVNDVTDSDQNLSDLRGSRDSLINGLGVSSSFCSSDVVLNSRKRRLPVSTELCITQFTCSPKNSVAATLPTKAARFTFDFPMVAALASSPALCQSPLLSPS